MTPDDEFDFELDGCRLVRTSFACPEQYDVYQGKEKIGYLRLRHGHFTAETPDCLDDLVYESSPEGDGIFEDTERMPELRKAIKAIQDHRRKKERT
jgi:hypothetical protein